MATVLLIEDDKLLRYALKRSLAKRDFVVFEAANRQDALVKTQEQDIDIFLLDLGLPDGNGLDVVTDLRGISKAPIIILSGDGEQDKRDQSAQAGANGYLIKPVEIEQLLTTIKKAL